MMRLSRNTVTGKMRDLAFEQSRIKKSHINYAFSLPCWKWWEHTLQNVDESHTLVNIIHSHSRKFYIVSANVRFQMVLLMERASDHVFVHICQKERMMTDTISRSLMALLWLHLQVLWNLFDIVIASLKTIRCHTSSTLGFDYFHLWKGHFTQ